MWLGGKSCCLPELPVSLTGRCGSRGFAPSRVHSIPRGLLERFAGFTPLQGHEQMYPWCAPTSRNRSQCRLGAYGFPPSPVQCIPRQLLERFAELNPLQENWQMYPCSSSLYPILSSGEESLARGRRRVTRVVLGVTRWLTAKRQTDVPRTFC